MTVRDHSPQPIDKFMGLWARGDVDNTPIDHFQDCNNVTAVGNSSFGTRPGIGISQDVLVPLSNIKRIYNYPTQIGNTLLVLAFDDGTNTGTIYHVKDATTVFGPILTIVGMTDFAFIPFAGRAYISPFSSFLPVSSPPIAALVAAVVAGAGVTAGLHGYAYTFGTASGETLGSPSASATTAGGNLQVNLSLIAIGPPGTTFRNVYRTEANLTQLKLLTTIADNVTTVFVDNTPDGSLGANIPTINTATIAGPLLQERGLPGEFLYVYNGDGTAARKAAGLPLSGSMTVANGALGHTDPGQHLFGFVSETDTGYLSPPGLLTSFVTLATNSVSFGSVDVSPDPHVVRRHLVATVALPTFNGDLEGYQYFFVPNATIENNTDLFLNNISFYDQDLIDDASHLFDNFTEIPAGAVLTNYHERLCLAATYNDISLMLVSEVGEPEAINQISGLIIVPLDGNPITNACALRDILYVTKRARTVSYTDNDDVPSSWPLVIVDNALGTGVHGIGTVLDSGNNSVDFLIIATYQGISLFNGKYQTPELSWKIESFWKAQDRNLFRRIQILNASIQKEIYIILPDRRLLVGNYSLGMDYKNMRWFPWTFFPGLNTVAVVNIDEIILGCDLVTP